MSAPTPLWTSDAIAAATGGTAHGAFSVTDVAFDSREVTPGALFVAMPGTVSDGHAHNRDALDRGAAGLLVSRPTDAPHVLVADTARALEALGAAARARVDATIVGVTGSVGKTGVKEALGAVFERIAPGRTHRSVKSYNNHTGVPLSLARMPAQTRFGVFEMGMNHAGEIVALTRQVRPHIAAVTWVAPAHIENFSDEAGIAGAKAEIFAGLEPGGTAVIPRDNAHHALLRAVAAARGARVLSFGEDDAADVRALDAAADAAGTQLVADVAGSTLHCRIALPGAHWVSNALCVLAVVHAAGGDVNEAGLALAEMVPLAGRGARRTVRVAGGEATLLDESYNANPASMAAALALLGTMPGRRLAVLGAMRELGERSDDLHAALAAPVEAAGVATVALVDPAMAPLADRLGGRATLLADADTAMRWAAATLRPGDVLLVKGSNSIGLARLVAALTQTGKPA